MEQLLIGLVLLNLLMQGHHGIGFGKVEVDQERMA